MITCHLPPATCHLPPATCHDCRNARRPAAWVMYLFSGSRLLVGVPSRTTRCCSRRTAPRVCSVSRCTQTSVLREAPLPSHELSPDISRVLLPILHAMTSRNPAERPSAAELLQHPHLQPARHRVASQVAALQQLAACTCHRQRVSFRRRSRRRRQRHACTRATRM